MKRNHLPQFDDTTKLLFCLCGERPILRQEDDGPCGFYCPTCFFSPDHFSPTIPVARRVWNSWVSNPNRSTPQQAKKNKGLFTA